MIKNITDWLDQTAMRLPDKVAFSDGTLVFTFKQLQHTAHLIGSALSSRGVFKKPILIALERSPRVVASFIGTAYSGNFYVPMDMSMPADNIAKIIAKLNPSYIITDPKYTSALENSGADISTLLMYDELLVGCIDETALEEVARRQIDTDLLCVFFTSGSTGDSKGVCITHRCVIDYMEMITETLGFDSTNVFSQSAAYTFDATMVFIYITLRNGNTCFVVPQSYMLFPIKLVDYLDENKVDTVWWMPTFYRLLERSGILEKRIPKHLKTCMFSGEVMPSSTLNKWRSFLPQARFINVFGPAEITDSFLYYIVDREFSDTEPLPIGKPYRNVEPLILNKHNELCAQGEIGELCIRAGKISSGYYNDPERTAAAFVQNPLNNEYREIIYRSGDLGHINERGEIMFNGRKDFTIRHSAQWVDLSEIEIVAVSLEGVDLCACVYDEIEARIVLYYSGTSTENNIKEGLKKLLDYYKVPGLVVHMDTIPINTNGKIDRAKLKKMI